MTIEEFYMDALEDDYMTKPPTAWDSNNDIKEICGGYGTDLVEFEENDLELLKKGKILHLMVNGGEYDMLIRLKEKVKC